MGGAHCNGTARFAAWVPADAVVERHFGTSGDRLDVRHLNDDLKASAAVIAYIAETGSTNSDLVRRLTQAHRVGEGDWLVTDRQTAGRGRQSRNWSDGSGNFMGSTIVYPGANDPPRQTLALLAGMAVYETCLEITDLHPDLQLKWPNDLLIGRAKIAGILLEAEKDAVIVGIGVNLANAPSLPDRETTSFAKLGPIPKRDFFAEQLATQFCLELERWRSYGIEPLLRRWQLAAHPKGTELSVHDAKGMAVSGMFDGLGGDGSLLLRLADGSRRAIHAGDVILN